MKYFNHTKTLLACCASLAAASAGAPAQAQLPQPATEAVANSQMSAKAPSPAALQLAALFIPKDLFISANISTLDEGIEILAKNSPELKATFTQYPGLQAALVDVTGKQLSTILLDEYPGLLDQVGGLVDARYTREEKDSLLAFYSSSAGIKMIRAEFEGMDTGKMLDAFAGDDNKITVAEVQAMTPGSAELGKDLTPAERAKASVFFMSPAGRKVAKTTPDMQALTVDWVNQLMVRVGPQIEAKTVETVMSFIAKSGTK
jgi:hypothetical protein